MFRTLCVLAALGFGILVAAGCQQKQAAKSENGSSNSEVRAAAVGKSSGSTTSSSGSGGSGDSHSKTQSEPPPAKGGGLTLRDVDNGKELHVHPGQTITVILESSHANGFEWNMVSPQTPVLWTDTKPVYATSTSSSLGGEETWKFRAAKAGRQDVRLEYGRGKQSVPEKNYRFTVEVE
jgi:predicted secreted protein